jgi:hypothetical protein
MAILRFYGDFYDYFSQKTGYHTTGKISKNENGFANALFFGI